MKNLKLILAAFVVVMMTACTDLDTEITAYYTSYPDSDIATQAKLEGCYYYMRSEALLGRNFWEGVALQGDEIMPVCYSGGWYDNGRQLTNYIHDQRYDLASVGQFDDLMSGCNYCNTVIVEMGGANLDDEIVAPVRAARAFYLYWLMEEYGDVPLLNHSLEDGEVLDRTPRAEIAEWLEEELLAIIPQLTEDNDANTYGRPNKWMAMALLAKIYLNWGVYTNDVTTVTYDTTNSKLNDCVAICDEIINSGLFSVGSGYRRKFFPNNGELGITDFIYVLPMDPPSLGTGYDAGTEMDRFHAFKKSNLLYTEESTAASNVGPWGFTYASAPGGFLVVTPEAAERFNLDGDERNEMILMGDQYVMDAQNDYKLTTTPLYYYYSLTTGEGDEAVTTDCFTRLSYKNIADLTTDDWLDFATLDVGKDVDGDGTNMMKGYRLAKYVGEADAWNLYGRKQSTDIPIFRYADILLTKAECILRGATATNGDTAASLINEVRDCAGAPHVEAAEGSVTKQVLIDERSRELFYELWRRNDLIRFGMFEQGWCFDQGLANSDKTHRLMPIPQGVMDTNTNWSQNAGY